MSDSLKSLMRTFDNDVSLGLGIVVVMIGLLLRYVSPFEVFVEMWLFSVLGTVVLGVGFLLVVVGFIRLFTDRDSEHDGGKHLSHREFEKKYSEIGLTNSSSTTKTIETLADERKPLSRKEIAERSGLSIPKTANLLKMLVKKEFVLEFQARGSYYYALAEKGLRLSEDIKAAGQTVALVPTSSTRYRLVESWVHKHSSPYYKQKQVKAKRWLKTGKRMIIGQQLMVALGFLGGLFLHFGFNTIASASQTISLTLVVAVLSWLAITILCAVKLAGGLGAVTSALAWLSGFIIIKGDPLMSVGVTLLMSSVMIGAFVAFYSPASRTTVAMREQ
jgi:predicted transcriptional regulator